MVSDVPLHRDMPSHLLQLLNFTAEFDMQLAPECQDMHSCAMNVENSQHLHIEPLEGQQGYAGL